MSVEATVIEMAKQAKQAARKVAGATTDQKNRVLSSIADKIESRADAIQAENRKDIERAQEMGLTPAMIDRLTISDATITGAKGLGEPATIPTAAAVGNAVANALGIRITDAPLTPRTIRRFLDAAGKEA